MFIGLSTGSRNPQFPRFVRFSMQQAVLLDIALIFHQLFQSIFGATNTLRAQALVEPAALRLLLRLSLLYIRAGSATGKQPEPDALRLRVGYAAELQSIGPF